MANTSSPYDLDEWEELLRSRKPRRLDPRWVVKMRRAIENTPGETLGEKRAHWEGVEGYMIGQRELGETLGEKRARWGKRHDAPRATILERIHSYLLRERRKAHRAAILDILRLLINKHGRDAKAMPKKAPPDPTDHRGAALRRADQQEARDAALRVYEEKRAAAVAGLDPNTEEYKRRWTRWTRMIEDEMKG